MSGKDILIKHFADVLGSDYETVEGYYGEHIACVEEEFMITNFAETLTEDLQADYDGDLDEDDRAEFHYALMFNTMTIAWKRMLKEDKANSDKDADEFGFERGLPLSEDVLDETKGLISNKDWHGPDG